MRKKRTKKIAMMIAVGIIVLGIIIAVANYLGNLDFREWTDKNIFRKDIQEEKLPYIDLTSNDNTKIYAYGNYIALLENNILTIYSKSAKKVGNLNISVSTPIFQSEGDYLLIADEGGSKAYLIYNENLQWEKEVEGQIVRTTVNKNGETGIAVSGTTYKSVLTMYDISGNENFKTFLSTTNATDIAISEDGKYFSFAEINTTGTKISSKVKTISVEKAMSTPNDAIVNVYETDLNTLLIRIKYKGEKLVVFADDGVSIYSNGKTEKILNIDSNISFVDVDMDGYIACVKEANNEYELELTNVENNKTNIYSISDAVKKIYCKNNVTAIDVGNKVEFVHSSGWLIKKFSSSQNIKEIIIGKSIAAIVYKDRAEILGL